MTKQNTAKAAQPTTDLRQRAARARDAAGRFIKRAVPVESAPAEADPVLSLIEEHQAAYAEWDRLSAVWNEMTSDDPGYTAAMAASAEPGKREVAAFDALFSAQPITLTGAAAHASYLLEAVRRTSPDVTLSEGERALGAVASALCRLATAGPVPQHPDAALFTLGAQFMAAWVAEEANGDEPEYWACSRIAEQIVRTPAATVAGYGIKALLLARLDSDASGPHAPIEPSGPVDSWWNVLRQVQEGAAQLAGAPDTGIPVSVSVIDGRLSCPGHDLSVLSIVQLARLYPVVVRAEEVIGSAENAPCFWEASNTYRTPAGVIINREADRLGQFTSAIAKEISRRQPIDDDEAQEQANTLLAHLIETGGVAEHPELLAEINAKWGH